MTAQAGEQETIAVEDDVPRWVCWRYVDCRPDKKPDKRAVTPHTRREVLARYSHA